MSRQARVLEVIFFWCTVLTAFGSVAATAMEWLVFLGIGWDYISFNCLLGLTILSTFGLAIGAVGLRLRRRWANAVLLASCIYIPVAFVALTIRDFTPPAGWWPLLPLSLIEILLACLGFRSTSLAPRST